MAYLGQQPVVGRYILLDQISGGFNGTASGFTMSTAAGAQGVIPGLAQNVLLSLGGVIQQPGVDYTISGSGLTFTTPPVSGTTFFATVLGDAQSVGTPSDGTVTPASIASGFDFVFPNLSVTGVHTIASGTAAIPSLTITGDTDTGLFSPAANVLAITTSGSAALTVSGSNVGVGTSSPEQLIDVQGTTNPSIQIKSTGTDSTDNARLRIAIGGTTATSEIFFADSGASAIGSIQYRHFDNRLSFTTNNDIRAVINSSGNLGIGTTDPSQQKLTIDVNSDNTTAASFNGINVCNTDNTTNNGSVITFGQELTGNSSARIGVINTDHTNGSESQDIFFSTIGAGTFSERARIDSSGRLLVGTNSSFTLNREAALQVAGGTGSNSPNAFISATRFGTTSGGGELILGASNGSNGNHGLVPNNFGVGQLRFTGSDGANGRDIASVAAFVDGEPAADDMPGRLVFSTNAGGTLPTERMRISANGNLTVDTDTFFVDAVNNRVGVGTANPSQPLTVNGVARFENYIEFGGSISTPSTAASIYRPADNNLAFGTANAERLRIDAAGRLLVGTASSIGGQSIQVGTSTGTLGLYKFASNDDGGEITLANSRNATVGDHTVVNNNDFLGRIFFRGSDGSAFWRGADIFCQVDGAPGTGSVPGRLLFATTSVGDTVPTERMRIQGNGTVRFSNLDFVFPNTDNAVGLGFSGRRYMDVWAANGTIQTSDERAKTEITDANLGADFIKSLRPVSYKWIEGQNVDTGERDEEGNWIYESRAGIRTHWGFIAQEVKQAVDVAGVDFGGWVLTDKDDPDSEQALRYDQFIAPLTKALQEALAKIETLEQRLSDAGIA